MSDSHWFMHSVHQVATTIAPANTCTGINPVSRIKTACMNEITRGAKAHPILCTLPRDAILPTDEGWLSADGKLFDAPPQQIGILSGGVVMPLE